MNRRAFITFFSAAVTFGPGIAFATTVEDGIVAQLTKQGFSSISSEKTWLGRVRILAKRKDGSREIVINPRTGEILRDQFTALNASEGTQPILDDVGDAKGAGSSGSDDNGSGGGGSGDSGSGDGGSGDGSGGKGSDGGSGDGGSSGGGSGGSGKGGDGGDDKGKDN